MLIFRRVLKLFVLIFSIVVRADGNIVPYKVADDFMRDALLACTDDTQKISLLSRLGLTKEILSFPIDHLSDSDLALYIQAGIIEEDFSVSTLLKLKSTDLQMQDAVKACTYLSKGVCETINDPVWNSMTKDKISYKIGMEPRILRLAVNLDKNDIDDRIMAAEELVAMKLLPIEKLFQLYDALNFSSEEVGIVASVYDVSSIPMKHFKIRAILYAILKIALQSDREALVRAIYVLLNMGKMYSCYELCAYIVKDFLQFVPIENDYAWIASDIFMASAFCEMRDMSLKWYDVCCNNDYALCAMYEKLAHWIEKLPISVDNVAKKNSFYAIGVANISAELYNNKIAYDLHRCIDVLKEMGLHKAALCALGKLLVMCFIGEKVVVRG